jgi:hypothetical protein
MQVVFNNRPPLNPGILRRYTLAGSWMGNNFFPYARHKSQTAFNYPWGEDSTFFGFGAKRVEVRTGFPGQYEHVWEFVLPIWLPITLTGVYPLFRLRSRFLGRHALVPIGLMMSAYWAGTWLAVGILEPAMNPPGFTGEGIFAMLIVFAGAHHLGRHVQATTIHLAFGCVGASFLVIEFVREEQYRALGNGRNEALGWMAFWVIFVAAVGLVTRWIASRTWRRTHSPRR